MDEAIDRSRKGRIAKNTRMMGWIDTVQAARFHESTPILVTAPGGVPPPIRTSGTGAQNSRADDRYNRQESCIPPHRYLLLNPKKIQRQDGELTFLQPASGLALVPSMPATRLRTRPWPYPAKAGAASSCGRSVRSSRLRNSLACQGKDGNRLGMLQFLHGLQGRDPDQGVDAEMCGRAPVAGPMRIVLVNPQLG